MKAALFAAVTIAVSGCAQPAPTAAPVNVPAEQVAPSQKSDAELRADALLADLEKRQIGQARKDRDNPPPPPPRLDDFIARPSAPSAPAPSAVTAAPSAKPSATSPAGRDEQSWKNEMRTAEVRLTENARRLQEAIEQRDAAQRQMSAAVKAGSIVFAQAQEAFNLARADVGRLEAEVRNDRAAVERIREDARRANVPPGWLRWP